MTMPFRFGLQLRGSNPVAAAQRAEEIGFDVVLANDHIGEGPSPLPALSAIAAATSRIRLGTLVLNNDMRNPVHLAWEAATIDRLSDGRFELGLGAGHTPHEYAATGIELNSARVRKQRLAESVEIIRRLLDGETVDFNGAHFKIEGAAIEPPTQERLPILVGGNGAALLAHAGAYADIIGLQGLGRTKPDGHQHSVRWDPEHLSAQVELVRDGAGDRFDDLEFNAMVQAVDITDERQKSLAAICELTEGLALEHAAQIPYLLVGTVDEIVEHLHTCRQRWGISYFVVRALEAFEPIIGAIRANP